MADRRLLAISTFMQARLQPTIRTEDEFFELAHPRGIMTLCPVANEIIEGLKC